MAIRQVSDEQFAASVQEKRVALVDFTATWCPPCKALLPIMDELGQEYGEQVGVFKLDVDVSPETASMFGVMSMPTVIVFKDAQPVEKLVGLRSKETYRTIVRKALALS